MEEIFKSLSESVSEQCYDEIMGLVEEYLSETLTYGTVRSAINNSIPSRLQKYKEVKANPSSTPQDIKRASDRVDIAAAIKKAFKREATSDKYKVGDSLKHAIRNAHLGVTMSPEEKRKIADDAALKRQEGLQKMWNTQPNHYNWSGGSNGFKYGKKKTL